MTSVGAKTELLNVLGDVKARVQDKLGIVDFPIPQFILVGKQSVGKSRCIETLAGETFNFISGTLGSRRPTVLEFRHVPQAKSSRWYVRDKNTNAWEEHPIADVMKIVGSRHEELGADVSAEPVYVRIESSGCVDMQIVDLPGFRDFALDDSKQVLADKIQSLVTSFMKDKRNHMLCVEQASDAANMSTLAKCREYDPTLERTVLIRNKLDKYYHDLTRDTVSKWVEGFGDIPENLARFALTCPFWQDGTAPPKSFSAMTEDKNAEDLKQMQSKGLSAKYMKTIGFRNFASFLEKRIEVMFAEAIGPVLANLKELQKTTKSRLESLETEHKDTDPKRILHTTRDCGISFASALQHVMGGVLDLDPAQDLEDELRAFHSYHAKLGSNHFTLLPSEDFATLDAYILYLRDEMQITTFAVQLNGGAQYRRVCAEVEIFLRFSEIAVETKKRDVVQSRGVAMTALSWRDVVVKLLSHEGHHPLQKRIRYVGERIKRFFITQKEPILEFMRKLEGTPLGNLHSPLYPKHAKLISQNEVIKHLIFKTYDNVCERQCCQFLDLFDNMLTSTFSNPWVFLKGATTLEDDDKDLLDSVLPSFDDTKDRIPVEIENRSDTEKTFQTWLSGIPVESSHIDLAVDKVQMLVLRAYAFIRCQMCDQIELFSEALFKLPMMRRLDEDMQKMELSEGDLKKYLARREKLDSEVIVSRDALQEVNWCIDRLNGFKVLTESSKS